MTPALEPRIMVTREMIEAHYKRVMATAQALLSMGNTAEAQDVLSEAIRLPYPIPAPASMPEAQDAHPAQQKQTTAQTARLIDADLAYFARAYCAMRAAQKAYFNTRSREDLIASKQAEKALDKAAALILTETWKVSPHESHPHSA